jgi:hypothetical protein
MFPSGLESVCKRALIERARYNEQETTYSGLQEHRNTNESTAEHKSTVTGQVLRVA